MVLNLFFTQILMNKRKAFKRGYRLIIALLLLIFLLLVSLYFAIQSPRFQNFISEKITNSLSEKLGTEISIGNIEVSFFNNILLEDFYVEDLSKDTLIYFKKANAKFSYVSLFEKRINLDEIELDGLNIELERGIIDTTFNFNFLIGNNQKKQQIDSTEVESWEIDINNINITNTKFNYNDSLTGTLLSTNVPALNVDVSQFDLNNKKVNIESLNLIKPNIVFTKTSNLKAKSNKEFVIDIPFLLYAQNLTIEKGDFNFKNLNDSTAYSRMALNDVKAKDIDIQITNTYLWKDSFSTKIDELNLIEESGFEIKHLNTQLSVNNKTILLDTLSLQTNKSNINTSAEINYSSFEDFKDFGNKVRFSNKLSNTLIDPDDLKYFVDTKPLGIGGVFKIEGEIRGRLNSIRAKDIKLYAGNRTRFEGSFSLNGLPDIKQTFISFKMEKLITDYADLKYIHNRIPLPTNTKNLGTILFKGRFDGFYTDFVTYGIAETALGTVETDINFKIDDSGIPAYSGDVKVKEFEIGQWFDKKNDLGAVTLSASIEGKGVKLNTINAELDAEIEKAVFKGYTYENIEIDGSIKEKFFKGKAHFDDKHLKMDFEGLVDITSETPIFDFTAKLDKIDLKPLNLSEKDYTLSAELNSNFTASSIDNILGELELKDFTIELDDKSYHLKQLSLFSKQYDNENHFNVVADNFDIKVHGDYQVSQLPKAIKHIFIADDSIVLKPQKLRFDAEINDKTDLISLFVPNLKIPEKIKISGNLDTETQSILTSINIPRIGYNNIKAKDFISNIQVRNGEIDMINSLPEVRVNDSIMVKDFSFIAKGFKDDISFNINAANKKENSALSLLGKLSYDKELFFLNLDTNSTILINNSFWYINKNNGISFNKDKFLAENFKISNGESEANLKVNDLGGTNNFILNLKNIEVEDFAEVLKNKGLDLKGKITGEVNINNFDKEPALSGDLDFLGISLNDYLIGDFKLDSRLDLPDKKVYLSGGLFSKENNISINGAYSFDKVSTDEDIDIDVFIKQFTVKSFEDLIPDFIQKSSGTLNGSLNLSGKRTEPNINGKVTVNDVTTTVSYTQVKYTIAETEVIFKKNLIQLADSLVVQDDEGNIAYGGGKITHENFKNLAIDLIVETPKVKALNTTITDNEDFYGTAYLNGGASFKGLTTEPLIYIWGKSEAKSTLDIPLASAVSNKQHEFYQFVTKIDSNKLRKDRLAKEDKEDENTVKITGAKVKLDLNINEDLELKLILDQDAGDVLKVNGTGDIKIDVGQKGEYVNFFGEYKVSKGDYLFTMQNVVNKPFRISDGSTISFNGDIYNDATVDMSATYSRKVALDNFITEYLNEDDEELKSIARSRVPVTLLLDLSEKLSKPTIKFDIDIDRVDPKLRNFVDSKLQAIKLNQSEMNNQIFGVLVLTKFLPSYTALESGIGENSSDAVMNTVTELISSQLSRYLTDWASYIVKDLEFFVNFSTYDQTTLGAEETLRKRRELQLALSKRFFNDRLSINVGGNFDFGESYDNTSTQASSSTFFGANVSFDYTITKNRRWQVKAFTVSDYDNYSTENNRTTRSGIGLTYKREFDDFKDLFNIKDKEEK